MGPEVQISPEPYSPSADLQPAIAYNPLHREFLVVWQRRWGTNLTDYTDIWARRVDAITGELRSSFYVTRDGGEQLSRIQPAVAYNRQQDEYLVVWSQDPSNHINYEIHGRTISWDGVRGPESTIWYWGNRSYWNPSVVWNSTNNHYLVTWNGVDTTNGQANDVTGLRLSSTLSAIGSPIMIEQDQATRPSAVSIAYNTTVNEYLAVWQHWIAATSVNNIYARRISANGSLPGLGYPVRTSSRGQAKPSVASSLDQYFVVWQIQGTYGGLDSRWLDTEGIPIGDGFGIFGDSGVDYPRMASIDGSNQFLGAYESIYSLGGLTDFAIEGGFANRSPSGINSFVCTFAWTPYWDNSRPAVAGGGVGFLLAYESWSDYLGQPRRIWGRLLKTYQNFLPLLSRD